MERKRSLDFWPEAGLDDGDPAEKKQLLLCADFTTIASCEAAVARRYLTENAWEMERALNAYFEPRAEEGAVPHRPETAPEPGSCVDLTSEEPADPTCSGSHAPDSLRQEDGSAFSLITWNIDGLDLSNLLERAKGVCSFLALYSPDVVFLQEVIPPYYSFLKKRASNYTIVTGHTEGYFTAIMLKKSRVTFKSQEIIPFPKTKMMRNLLCVHASVSGNGLCLMTSHLESTREHAQERMNQLKMVLKKMQEAPESATVIFAGDTNLRDREHTHGERHDTERTSVAPVRNDTQSPEGRKKNSHGEKPTIENNLTLKSPSVAVCPATFRTSGSFWANPSTASIRGTPRRTRTWGYVLSAGIASIESFSEQPQMAATSFPKVWTSLGWRNWIAAGSPAITGASCATWT
ncbi:tyrosyl-DNA phosphodiesterase 2 isoform X1 [Desmodus rotundus]|uniref:tyrosyl-DNA phosphodiesterase 2 isoform X1 n=1 Tax=Desmodus rotundus TaxID=9430 RepID=UPI00238154CD|nr:tyrosyl-DNA phosphodiesterase 2 isoform X1 [Desmodus rotundus]